MENVLYLEDRRRATTCLCGNQIAPGLARLGSTWCHDCRDDHRRRDAVLRAHAAALRAA